MCGDVLGCHSWAGNTGGISWAEAEILLNILSCNRQPADTRFIQVQIISGKVETPCPRGDPEVHKQPGYTLLINVSWKNTIYTIYIHILYKKTT